LSSKFGLKYLDIAKMGRKTHSKHPSARWVCNGRENLNKADLPKTLTLLIKFKDSCNCTCFHFEKKIFVGLNSSDKIYLWVRITEFDGIFIQRLIRLKVCFEKCVF